jgi:hypothetical protein
MTAELNPYSLGRIRVAPRETVIVAGNFKRTMVPTHIWFVPHMHDATLDSFIFGNYHQIAGGPIPIRLFPGPVIIDGKIVLETLPPRVSLSSVQAGMPWQYSVTNHTSTFTLFVTPVLYGPMLI